MSATCRRDWTTSVQHVDNCSRLKLALKTIWNSCHCLASTDNIKRRSSYMHRFVFESYTWRVEASYNLPQLTAPNRDSVTGVLSNVYMYIIYTSFLRIVTTCFICLAFFNLLTLCDKTANSCQCQTLIVGLSIASYLTIRYIYDMLMWYNMYHNIIVNY